MMPFERDNIQNSLLKKNSCPLKGQEAASMAGVFPVCKPEGVTSFRIVQQLRRLLHIKKVGHTGTLDPFASGVLVLCAGRTATRLISQLMEGDKEYEAVLRLGVITDLLHFTGEQMQKPPLYSALKHRGKPLYYYARKGLEVAREPRLITVKELQCLAQEKETVKLRIVCAKGTYIRTLAADIGEFLGCGAYLEKLIRTRNGFFSLTETLPGEKLFGGDAGRSLLDLYRIPVDTIKELLACGRENN
jgi:tRNA pseudouridine55 synthase